MTDIKVRIEKNPVQVTNDIQNFQVSEIEWDLGHPIGNGATLEEALEDFRQMYECKYDEEVNAIIVE
jgi:hypothetical protein